MWKFEYEVCVNLFFRKTEMISAWFYFIYWISFYNFNEVPEILQLSISDSTYRYVNKGILISLPLIYYIEFEELGTDRLYSTSYMECGSDLSWGLMSVTVDNLIQAPLFTKISEAVMPYISYSFSNYIKRSWYFRNWITYHKLRRPICSLMIRNISRSTPLPVLIIIQ